MAPHRRRTRAEPVDYVPLLSCQVANLVPVDDIERATAAVNAYTQTVGIYPESLKRQLRDTLPLFGAQRLTSLGYACHVAKAMPQDAIEPVRRMCKWAPAVVEDEHLAGAQGLVGQDDLELIAVGMRDEEVELDGLFLLLFDARPNKEEAVGRLPGLGFPPQLSLG